MKNDLNSKICGVNIISSRFLIKDKSTCFKLSASKTIGFLILLTKTLNNFDVSSQIPAPGPIKTASTPSANFNNSSKWSSDKLSPLSDFTIKSGDVDLIASPALFGLAT